MSDTVTVSRNQLDRLYNRIAYLERVVRKVVEQIDLPAEELEPPYGTDEWWEWSDRQAFKDIQAGRTTALKTKEDIDRFFDTL